MPTTRAQNQMSNTTPTNTSNKRVLSPESTPDDPDSRKKSKANNNKSATKINISAMSKEFNELKDLIGSLATSINAKIDDSRHALENKFTSLDDKFTGLATQVNAEVQTIKTTVIEFQNKIANDINSMDLSLKQHANRLDNNEDDIQRVQLSQDVRLVGFAVKENEDLVQIFRKIADHIGFATGNNVGVPTIERMSTKNHATGQIMPSPTIIIHFSSLRQKQLFYSLYLNKMPLNPENFGLTCDNRIVIGENLTKKNAQLFKSAQILRKNNRLAQTFTENGIVKIRFAKGKNEKTYMVRNQIELEEIVAQQETKQNHQQMSTGATLGTPANDTRNIQQTNNSTKSSNAHSQQSQQQQSASTSANTTMNNGEQQQQSQVTPMC